MDSKKKIIAPTLIAILTLSVLVIGATYAYVAGGQNNSFGTYTISSSIPSVGSVSITAGSTLSMGLTLTQVQKPSANVTYYATNSGPSTTATGNQTIATVSAANAGTFSCDYTLNIKGNPITMASNSVGKGTGLFVLTVNYFNNTGASATATYDFNTAQTTAGQINSSSGVNLTGKITGITSSAPKTITGTLKFVNSSTIDQSTLAGTSATFTFTVTAFSCLAS